MIGDEVFLAFALASSLGIALWKYFGPMIWTPDEWKRAARRFDLVPRGPGLFVSGHTHPQRDLSIKISSWDQGEDRTWVQIVVKAVDGGLVGLTLRPESRATARMKRAGASEIVTGDDAFDALYFVTGPGTPVRAVLDGQTRRAFSTLFTSITLEVVNGELRGKYLAQNANAMALDDAISGLLAAADRLRRPTDLTAVLARNARSDPEPRVRLENLLALTRDNPEDEITRTVLRQACDDPSDEVRVRAAAALGAEGHSTLLALARTEHVEDLPRARAVAALGDTLPAADLHHVLAVALRTRRLQTARACMEVLGRPGQVDAVPVLARVLALEEGDLAGSAARALAATGLPAAEAPLLAALTREPEERRAAAAAALGRVGSAAAVLPLKEAEARHGDEPTRRAARQAVAEIQARLPGASPGQLSLASDDAGALSLAEDETGRLSLDEKAKR